MERAVRPARHGSVLPLVVLLLLLLAATATASYFRTRQAGALVGQGLRGDLALLAADSAIDEMHARLRLAANRSGNPIFSRLREEVYAGKPGARALGEVADASNLESSLDSDEFRGVRLLSCSAGVLFQRQLEDLPYERFGIVRYTARAGGGRTSVREVTVDQEFRTVLATVPRPFDQTALFFEDATSLTDFGAANRLRERYLRLVGEQVRRLDRALALAPAGFSERYAKLRRYIPSPEALAARVTKLPETRPLALYALGAERQSFPLEALDLAEALLAVEARTEPSRQEAAAAMERVERAPADREAHEALAAAIPRALEGTQKLLDRIWAYSQAFHFLGPDDPQWQAVTSEYSRLGVDHWRRVAGYSVKGAAGLQALRARLGTLSGVVYVEADSTPIVFRGQWPGRLVVAVRNGSVVLEDVNSGAPRDALLTVVCLGGRAEVRGRAEASLVLSGPDSGTEAGTATLAMAPSAVLEGNLVAMRLMKQGTLTAKVICREKFRSGVTGEGSRAHVSPAHYVVQLAPAAVHRHVDRS